MRITEKLLTTGKPARSGRKFRVNLKRLIIHWIGPYPGQAVTSTWNHFENGDGGKGVAASAHFIVKETDVLQCLPLNEVGWHSGDMRNFDSIGIEVIPANAAGEFSVTTVETLRELVAHIRKETGRPLPLERHYDGAQKKDCPRYYTPVAALAGVGGRVENPPGGDGRWEELKAYLNGEV